MSAKLPHRDDGRCGKRAAIVSLDRIEQRLDDGFRDKRIGFSRLAEG